MVRLEVIEAGDAVPDGGKHWHTELEASDLRALVRDHPGEAEKYVRPLLRDLGQKSLLEPEARTAWQVFPDRWRPDPEAARKVRELLPGLGGADFHSREAAEAGLRRLGDAGTAVLLHTDRAGLSPEQNLGIDRLLADLHPLSAAEAAGLRDDTEFLLDCLTIDDAKLRAAALDRLRELSGKDLSFDPDAPDADRDAALSVLRRQFARPAGPATQPATE